MLLGGGSRDQKVARLCWGKRDREGGLSWGRDVSLREKKTAGCRRLHWGESEQVEAGSHCREVGGLCRLGGGARLAQAGIEGLRGLQSADE